MDDSTISAVVSEIAPVLIGRAPGKIFQLDQQSVAIDFGLRHEGYLFISTNPALPRLYLIKRRVRDLEKLSLPSNQFTLTLRKELSQTRVTSIEKIPADRIVWFKFKGVDDLNQQKERTLVVQLTGRSANLLLLDQDDVIISRLRSGKTDGQSIAGRYQSPKLQQSSSPRAKDSSATAGGPTVSEGNTLSEALDAHYTALTARQAVQADLSAARAELRKEISRRKKLLKQLNDDLAEHSDAEQHKRTGDLLLANVATAKRQGGRVKLVDYFAEDAPLIEIELDEKITFPEEASRRFAMFSRSKRARKQIAARIEKVEAEIAALEQKRKQLESPDTSAIASQQPQTAASPHTRARAVVPKRIPGVRRYVSSDGFEILVGRAAKDNDNLTFKVAKPNDLWLHAADYAGSHVIVRNATRKEIPHRTLIEAAQLAAYFSQANKDPKVDVHYTERKFVSKSKGAAPGLVRLTRFKNITVAPKQAAQRVV
jgi:predicted ribosome quality control (RQC) complex YloA/Tae2 family protein